MCTIDIGQKQFNLFIIESQNTQLSLYFVSQVIIQNERLHKLITLVLIQYEVECAGPFIAATLGHLAVQPQVFSCLDTET